MTGYKCSQHIDRKCTKCGFGLPLLERKRLRNFTRQRKIAQHSSSAPAARVPNSPLKREASLVDLEEPAETKRPRIESSGSRPSLPEAQLVHQPKLRPWKDVYRDRFCISSNWKHGRAVVTKLSGHVLNPSSSLPRSPSQQNMSFGGLAKVCFLNSKGEPILKHG